MSASLETPDYGWRAELLAKVALTRRPDLAVLDAARPWDLVVELLDGDARSGQVFAVDVTAALRPEDLGQELDHGEIALRPEWIERIRDAATRATHAPLPVCFVVYAMTHDRGYYAWIRRPVRDGSPEGLVTEHAEYLLPFTREALDEIVALVHEWYRLRRRHAAAI